MKNKALSMLLILCFCVGYSQTNNKTGIQTKTPTETLDINGTTRLRALPLDGTNNAINTNPNGTASAAKDQTFTAARTVVVDANGVVGTIDGVAITAAPDVKTISYVRTSTPIDANTPTASVTILGNLIVHYSGTTSNTGNWVEFKTKVPTHVTAFAQVAGGGAPTNTIYSNWRTTVSTAATTPWLSVSAQGLTPSNRDTYNAMITLHNTQELYRVSLICNGAIPASGGVPYVAGQVIIFIEKLQ